MKRLIKKNLKNLMILAKWIWNLRHELDPRIVRLEDPSKHIVRIIATLSLFVITAVCAVTLATSGTKQDNFNNDYAEDIAKSNYSVNKAQSISHLPKSHNQESHNTVLPNRASALLEKQKKPHDFHDPLYIFTDEPAQSVTAYPLADPPGIVINLEGLAESDSDPDTMVGKDKRVRTVRKRSTENGIRYILTLTTPIKRIDIVHEGNVVIISPVL